MRLGAGLGEVGDGDVVAADLLGRVLERVEGGGDGQRGVAVGGTPFATVGGTAPGEGEDEGGDGEGETVAHRHENDSQMK